MAEKTLVSFQTLLKGTFSLLTCHLQFSITAIISMTLKRQSVQSLSDHKTGRSFCVSQERGIVERMVWSETKWSFPLVWIRGVGWGCWRVSETDRSITKRQKCSTLKLNIYHKKLGMKECTSLTCNRPSDSWEKAKKSELEKMTKGRVRVRGRKILVLSPS